jgi:hypothetical protein
MLLQWYRTNWAVIVPWLPHVHLVDKDGHVIDGSRERVDMGIV